MYTKRKKSQKTNSNVQRLQLTYKKKKKNTKWYQRVVSRIDEKVPSNVSSNFERTDWLNSGITMRKGNPTFKYSGRRERKKEIIMLGKLG